MKILIWAPFVNKVGTTTNVINSISALTKFSEKKKYKIDLIDVFGEWGECDFEDVNINKIKLINNDFILKSKKNGFLRSRFYTILIFLFSLMPLLKLLKKNDYNFVIVHLITSLPILLFCFIKTKTKLILSIAGFPKLTLLRKFFWRQAKKYIYKILCPSEETRELLVKNKIFKESQIFIVKDPHISVKKIIKKKNKDIDKNLIIPKKFILAIGRLTKQKNYNFLISAFSNILSLDRNINLIIIGEGEERKKIESKIRELNIEKNVILLGNQENIYKFLKKAYCYFSASIWEGGPGLSMLDAAFLNIPIICSDCKSGRKEFINNGKRGYIFKTNNMNSFTNEFSKFFYEEKNMLKEKLINSKKEVRNFTLFKYYLDIIKILN
jgi:glycosyltransferase involved in cell wall biosynthesis